MVTYLFSVCPSVEFTFSQRRQTSDYVRYYPYVPNLYAATVCAWITVYDDSHGYAVMSYARSSQSNDFLIYVDDNNLNVWINGNAGVFTINLQRNTPVSSTNYNIPAYFMIPKITNERLQVHHKNIQHKKNM